MNNSDAQTAKQDPINIVLYYRQLGLVSATAQLLGEDRLVVETGQVMLHKHDKIEAVIPLPDHQTVKIKATVIESNSQHSILQVEALQVPLMAQVRSLPQRHSLQEHRSY